MGDVLAMGQGMLWAIRTNLDICSGSGGILAITVY